MKPSKPETQTQTHTREQEIDEQRKGPEALEIRSRSIQSHLEAAGLGAKDPRSSKRLLQELECQN